MGRVATKDCIRVDLDKIIEICDLDRPTSLIEIWSFISSMSYYQCFVDWFLFYYSSYDQVDSEKGFINGHMNMRSSSKGSKSC